MTAGCPVCGSGLPRPFLSLRSVPVHCNVLLDDEASALAAPRGDISLACCASCGLLRNLDFDPSLVAYAPGYENSLHFSPTFQAYAETLARSLVERYEVRGEVVAEVGCGSGDFLALLAAEGGNRALGFDPSFRDTPVPDGVTVLAEPLDPGLLPDRVALACCRQVVEHLDDPRSFMTAMRHAFDGRGLRALYVEVPDARYMLDRSAVWDLIYEHPSYFAAPALEHLLRVTGFVPLRTGTSFGGQYLWSEAAPAGGPAAGSPPPDDVGALATAADRFEAALTDAVSTWDDRVAALVGDGERVALWGAGSKGVMFLNLVPHARSVECVIDVSPVKTGRYVPGSGHRVVAPAAAAEQRISAVILMNPLYRAEVEGMLDALGVRATVLPMGDQYPRGT